MLRAVKRGQISLHHQTVSIQSVNVGMRASTRAQFEIFNKNGPQTRKKNYFSKTNTFKIFKNIFKNNFILF